MSGGILMLFGAIPAFRWGVACPYLLPVAGLLCIAVALTQRGSAHRLKRLQRLEEGLSSASVIVIGAAPDGTIDQFNQAAEEALGYSAEEVEGRIPMKSLQPDWGFLGQGKRATQQPLRRKDGSTIPAMVAKGFLENAEDLAAGQFILGFDMTFQQAESDALREKQELLESIAATSPTVFYVFDVAERKILYANRPLASALGYTDTQIAQMGPDPLPTIMHPEDLDILFNRYLNYAQMRDGEVLEIEFRCLSAQGELRWLYARDVVFKRDGAGDPTQILVNMLDVTERKVLDEQIESQVLEIQDTNLALEIQTNALEEANLQLESLAFTDGLTGIANHRSFQEELARCFDSYRRRRRRLSLMFIDVDRFKEYNDTYGHPSGDIVLKHVASVLRECCSSECLPARYGGEEFAVLCPGMGRCEVLKLAEEIRSAIEQTPWPERSVTVSIGAVSLTPEIATPSDLVTAADCALYSSKASGRNCVTFYDFDSRHRMAS